MAELSRATLQIIAKLKIQDARLLFENTRYSSAYYLYGYGVEVGLKACIARLMVAETVPDPSILKGFLDHNYTKLVGLAGLVEPLKIARKNSQFDSRWAIVTEWSVDVRYDLIDPETATAMQDAVENPDHGVMQWLHQFW